MDPIACCRPSSHFVYPVKHQRLQTASQDSLPPLEECLFKDPLVVANTRFNPGRTHRYTLFRYWGDPAHYCAFVGMNPSGADEVSVDRTVMKCCNFSARWGFGALYMLNAFALRATNSEELYLHSDPVGPENDRWIREIAGAAARIVVAWGKPGGEFGRGKQVEAIVREACQPEWVFCFGRNRDGTPTHPLYQPNDKQLLPYF